MVKRLTLLVVSVLILFGLALTVWLLLIPASRPPPPPLPQAATPLPEISATAVQEPDPYISERLEMVRDQIQARGVADQAVLETMRRVSRHRFVLPQYLDQAYEDHPLPIGQGQTISQPYIVALMTEALKLKPGDRVLEIGTGSGYQAAILADLGAETYTIEIIPQLASQAEQRLKDMGYANIKVRNADGYYGWPEYAPFDAIIVTAAPDHLPQPLANQLKEGGRLIIPIGPTGSVQTLWLFEKREGKMQATNLGGVLFVPLTGTGHPSGRTEPEP